MKTIASTFGSFFSILLACCTPDSPSLECPPHEVPPQPIACSADADCGPHGPCFKPICNAGVCDIIAADEGRGCNECFEGGACNAAGVCAVGEPALFCDGPAMLCEIPNDCAADPCEHATCDNGACHYWPAPDSATCTGVDELGQTFSGSCRACDCVNAPPSAVVSQ